MGFKRVCSDPSIFVWELADGSCKVIVPMFVDDLTFASKSLAKIEYFKAELEKWFKLRDLGPTSFLLVVEITRDRPVRTLRLSQHQYILDILERFKFSDCSPVQTPLDPGIRLDASMAPSTPEDTAYMATVPYINVVSTLR